MPTVEFSDGAEGTCAYCEQAPAAKTVHLDADMKYPACADCAVKVRRGTEDAGYVAYCAVHNGSNCPDCGVPLYECTCGCADEVEAEAVEEFFRDSLPARPPGAAGREG